MNVFNIVISGKSPEAFAFFTKLSESPHHVFMNEYPSSNCQQIDLLLVFDDPDQTIINSLGDDTSIFCFNPSMNIEKPLFYHCHFKPPSEGESQDYLTFTIDTEIDQVKNKFSQIYGLLITAGYEISFNESRSSAFQHIFAASTIQKKSDNQSSEKVAVSDPKSTQFHLIIALDCTGSMGVAIQSIQASLLRIVSTIKDEFPKILISFYAFRDYCDPVIIKKTLFEMDSQKILDAIKKEPADGGGDTPEAHKTCLAEIKEDIFVNGTEMTNVCFFITDAPPHLMDHSSTYTQEVSNLKRRNLEFASDWIELAHSLLSDGIQVFSFSTSPLDEVLVPMTLMSQITQGLCFVIPNSSQVFEKQMISIVSNLMNNSSAETIEGIQMASLDSDLSNVQKEIEMFKLRARTITDNQEIQNALLETGSLMRLKPSDRGARRVTISSVELIDTGITAIKALKSFYKIVKGDEKAYSFFDEQQKFQYFSKQLKEAKPTNEWLTSSSISCICSMMSISDAFDFLSEINENEIEESRDIGKIIEILGNFIIGYPFLFQLSETGKFNMQDAWPIIFKDASTAYTMSIASLFHIITSGTKTDTNNKMINKFKDFIASQERSGIVPVCPDLMTKFALKILETTKWLDALVSYGLHRHIEPLPQITRATGCAFIINISRQAFFSKTHQLSSGQKEALKLVSQTLFSLSFGCENMMKELTNSINETRIPYNAYSPQDPYICSTPNKIINCFLQLHNVIAKSDRNFISSFFNQAITEAIALFSQFVSADEKDKLMMSIFDDIPVDVNKVTEQNPLEVTEQSLFKDFVYHEIENFKVNKMSSFIFKVLWNLMREDEFEEPTNLLLTSSLALAIATQTRSNKYKMIEKDDEEKQEDEKPKYEINPIFATQDPLEILRVSCFIYFTQKKKNAIQMLQANRKKFLTEKCIDNLLIPFKSCNYNEFYEVITKGFSFEWMKEPFKLDVLNTPMIVNKFINEVKEADSNSKAFYENCFYLLFLGKDKEEKKWAVDTCRDIKCAQSYVDHFLKSDKEIFKFYLENRKRSLPNRHGHNFELCPNQEEYSEDYARKRIICCIAPFYYFPELPKKVKNFDTSLIKHLAHKRNAPPENEIFQMALRIKKEIQTANPDCEKEQLKKRNKKRRNFRPRNIK